MSTNEEIMEKLDGFILSDMKKAMDEIERIRAENEELRRDVKTAVMGDSAELRDVKRENEKLREALSEAEGHLEYAYMITFRDRFRDAAIAARSALAAIRENGVE